MDFTTNILLSIIVFLGIVLLLVALLLWVRNKLMPKGKVNITINDDKVLTVPTGNTLIATLAEQKVYLPSACGGKGSCGQCKCRVVEGGGTILPTEVGFFTRKQIQDHWRLGCQVFLHFHLTSQADSGPLALGMSGESEGKPENRGAAVDSECEGI